MLNYFGAEEEIAITLLEQGGKKMGTNLSKKEIIMQLRRTDPFWVYRTHDEKWERVEDYLRYKEESIQVKVAVRLGSYADLM